MLAAVESRRPGGGWLRPGRRSPPPQGIRATTSTARSTWTRGLTWISGYEAAVAVSPWSSSTPFPGSSNLDMDASARAGIPGVGQPEEALVQCCLPDLVPALMLKTRISRATTCPPEYPDSVGGRRREDDQRACGTLSDRRVTLLVEGVVLMPIFAGPSRNDQQRRSVFRRCRKGGK